ncbi:UNVERIFIED_CONTAM: hypothetical protein HDU68_012271, partial [Siphonaria sp. JEL0065]
MKLVDTSTATGKNTTQDTWFIPANDVAIGTISLGEGGFGKVYAGQYGSNAVAIKSVSGLITHESLKMMHDEASIWKSLVHPNITLLYGISEDAENNPVLVMEKLETSLYHRIYCDDEADLPTSQQKLKWLLQIAEAFKYMHSRDNPVVHADLNPRNVLL